MKRNILFLLSICMLLLTCSDGDDPIKEVEKPPVEVEKKDPFITLKKSNIDFTNEGGTEAILIESNVTWTIKSSASWCTVTPSSGNKSTESITFSAPANEEYDNRSCTVTIEGKDITKTITVNQGENLGLLVTQDRYELGNEENTIAVEVKANVDFEVEIHDEWITQVETRGLTTSELEFKIAENDSYNNREGSITIKQKDGNISSTITIFQSQEDAIILSETDFDLSSQAQSVEVEIKTNIDYEIIIPEDSKEWVSHSTTRSLRTETVVLDIAQNKDYDERTAKIVVKDKKTNLQENVTIKQAANTGLIVSEDKYELSNDGGIIEVEVKANVGFDIEIADKWITSVETRGLIETKLQFQVAKNENYDSREGTIIIKQKNGELSSTIKVYQSQKDAIIISEKDFYLSSEAQSVEVEVKTNIDYEVIIPEDAKDWVSHATTRALETKSITLDISENDGYDTRYTEIYIKNIEKEIEHTLTISQRAYDKILLTVNMPIIIPSPRLIIDFFYSYNKWQTGDELSFAFVKEGETTINVKATEKAISTDSTEAQFELDLPEGYKEGEFELYGVYNGGGELNGTKVAYPTNLNDATSDKELRKREMLYFKTALNVSHNKRFSVELEQTISALKVSFENTGSVTIKNIKEMRFASKANINWAYDLYDKNNIYDLKLGEFQNFETNSNFIPLKADKSDLVSGETTEYWGWYFPTKNSETPDLELQIVKNDDRIIPLTEFKAETFIPNNFTAGHLYNYQIRYDSDILLDE